MFGNQFVAAVTDARRALPSFGLAAILLTSTLGAPDPALAADPIIRDHRNGGPPVARIQVFVKHMRIVDDRDWGDGEFDFWFSLICFQTSTPCLGGYGSAGLDGFGRAFSAGSGETVPFNRTLPGTENTNPDYDASADFGYPLRPGHRYQLRFGMTEKDKFTDYEKMGQGTVDLTPENDWGAGNYTLRSTRDDGSPGDYELAFEVRRILLPDLRPGSINVLDLQGSTKRRVCMPVQNIGPSNAGPFEVALHVDDVALPDGRGTALGLTPSNGTEVCVEAQLPTSGQHKLAAVVDPVNALIEFNEANNIYEQSYTAPAQGATAPALPATASTLPGLAPGAAQADLTVSGIRVNGQVPDGKDDCKDGKNAVTVVVKNAGAARAEEFVVWLVVDGDDADEASVDGLEAGKEYEVRFDDVRLKKGARTFVATLDPKNAVAESSESNNSLKVEARCKSDE
jgi:hypothetical protein